MKVFKFITYVTTDKSESEVVKQYHKMINGANPMYDLGYVSFIVIDPDMEDIKDGD